MLKGCINKAGDKQFLCPHGYVKFKKSFNCDLLFVTYNAPTPALCLSLSRWVQASQQPFRTLGASITQRNVILELNACKIAFGTSQSFNKTEKQLQADARHTLVSVQLSSQPAAQLSSLYLDVRISSTVLRQQPLAVILTTKLNTAVWEPWNVRYRWKCCTYTATILKKINPLTPEPFNAGIKSLRATLLDEIFLLGILLLEPWISLIYAWKTNKCNNYSFSLLIMYCSSYMFRYYIAIFRERS
jgi:hypothetical protein